MTLSLKFHEDPSICWGDMRKMMLNMHARVIYACSKFWYTSMHAFALCVRECAQISTKIFLVVHYSVENLSFKFHKDLIIRWGDMGKIMLNMHARVIYACSKFRYTCVHAFALCARVCAQIFTKIFLVVHSFVENLSFKFHKDLIFCWGDICKI